MTQGGNLFCSHRFLTADAGPLAASRFGTGGFIHNFPFSRFVAKGVHRFRIQHFHAADAGLLAASRFCTGGFIHNFPLPFDMLHCHFTGRCQLFIHAADCRNLCGSRFVPCDHSSIFIHSGHLFVGSCPHHTLFFCGICWKVGNTQNSAFSVVQGKVFLIQLNFRQRFFFFCICRICIRRQRRKSKRLIAHTCKISHCHVVLSYSFSIKSGAL